ncbi:MAG: hypothetical protein KU37_03040 [Sulfuricurvum sp. PC08-66]|nr:MAG: hypothetical protein KU37_03040 [Sulfuricurvum sp. PC08-66]
MPAMRMLIVEDDQRLCKLLVSYFEETFQCDYVHTFKEARSYIDAYHYSIVLLDRSLDGDDVGMTLIKTIKDKNFQTGVIVISSYGSSMDKIDGLSLGADDYMDKPFDNNELKARIHALVRRTQPEVPEFEGYKFDWASQRIYYAQTEIALSKKESAILFFLLHKMGQIIPKEVIMDAVYQNPENVSSNTIDVTIGNIRKKLPVNIIKTIKTRGYTIEK